MTTPHSPASGSGDERQPERRRLAPAKPSTLQERLVRKERARRVVNRYMLLAGMVGLIPSHFLGQVVAAGLLGKMLHDLCRIYGTRLADQKVKAVIAAVLGGAHSDWIASYVARYSDRAFPGTLTRGLAVARPLSSGAIAYAIGMLFVHHLDTGAWVASGPARESLRDTS